MENSVESVDKSQDSALLSSSENVNCQEMGDKKAKFGYRGLNALYGVEIHPFSLVCKK